MRYTVAVNITFAFRRCLLYARRIYDMCGAEPVRYREVRSVEKRYSFKIEEAKWLLLLKTTVVCRRSNENSSYSCTRLKSKMSNQESMPWLYAERHNERGSGSLGSTSTTFGSLCRWNKQHTLNRTYDVQVIIRTLTRAWVRTAESSV